MPEALLASSQNAAEGFAGWYEGRPAKSGVSASARLDVKVSMDWHKVVMVSFYGGWCGNSTVRVGTNGLPAIPIQAIKDALEGMSQVVSAFELSGLALAGLEGVSAVVDISKAVWDKRAATRKMAAAQEAHGRALFHLGLYRLAQDQKRRAPPEQQMAKLAVTNRAREAVVPGHGAAGEAALRAANDAVVPHTDQIAPEAQPPGTGAGQRAESAPLSLTTTEDRTAALNQAKLLFSKPDCDGYLSYVDAANQHRKAAGGLLPNVIALLRDLGVQGARVVVDVLKKAGEIVLPEFLGHVFPWIFSLLMGVFHGVAAAIELRRANKAKAEVEQVLEQTDRNNELIASDEKRQARLTKPQTLKVIAQFRENLRRAAEHAGRQRRWAIARFFYAAFSTASGVGTVVACAVLGVGLIAGTGGLILGAVAIAAGVVWLGFAVYKLVVRILMERAQAMERGEVEAALKAQSAAGELSANTLEQCNFGDFDKLVSRYGNLHDNQYLEAAKLAKMLLMESEGKGQATKQDRSEISTALQVLGMTKSMTSMLKRASFQKAHEAIYSHLRGDASQHAMSSGTFNRITGNSSNV